MIAKAIDKILNIAQPTILEINGETFTSDRVFRIDNNLRAQPLHVKTLTGLLDYISMDKPYENKNPWQDWFLHVVDEKTVALVSRLDSDRERETLVIAKAETPTLPIGTYMTNESFLIGVKANFVDDQETDKDLIIKFAGTVTTGTVADYSDDGITQKATIKHGVASKAEAIVPPTCKLRPYRTFEEVEQPVSQFVFRMKENGNNPPSCLLTEADGGAWKNAAMETIRGFLEECLKNIGIEIPVIA